MQLGVLELEQAGIDRDNLRRKILREGESLSDSDHTIPIIEPVPIDNEVEDLLHELQSLFDLDEDTDEDYDLDTGSTSPSSPYADSLASE